MTTCFPLLNLLIKSACCGRLVVKEGYFIYFDRDIFCELALLLKFLTRKRKGERRREWLLIFFVWLILIFLAVMGAVMLSWTNWKRYQETPIVISMERNFREWNTTFPSVTICPNLKYDNQRIVESALELNGVKLEDAKRFLKLLLNTTYHNLDELETDLPEKIIIEPQDYIKYILKDSPNFYYSSNNFTRVLLEMGVCYTYINNLAPYFSAEELFNGTSSKMKTFEERRSSPLDGVINVQIFNMSSAAEVYIHSPSEIPDSSSKKNFLDLKHYLKLTANVKFAVHSTDEIRSLSVSQRKCRFQEESNLDVSPVYSYNLCQMQCRVDLARRLCGCVPHFYRTRTPLPVCDFRGLQCLAKEKHMLITLRNKGRRLCECLPLCSDIIYTTETESEIEWLLGTNLEVTMSKYPHMRLKRDILFGFADLLVSVGATGGLFLGCSILSFVETIYFFSLHLFWHMYKQRLTISLFYLMVK